MVRPKASNQGSRHLSEHDLDRTFFALADSTRRSVVELLRDRPRRAGELAEELGSTPAGLSRHLRILRESGLVTEDALPDDARVKIYRLERQCFEDLRSWIEDIETFWTGQLESFKAHIERTRKKRTH